MFGHKWPAFGRLGRKNGAKSVLQLIENIDFYFGVAMFGR